LISWWVSFLLQGLIFQALIYMQSCLSLRQCACVSHLIDLV
jgi:hypothetical protein